MTYLLAGDCIEIALKLLTTAFLLASLLSFAVIQTRKLYRAVSNIQKRF
jgi:hypothetical protein